MNSRSMRSFVRWGVADAHTVVRRGVAENRFYLRAEKGEVISVLTGICLGAGTIFFFLLFQKGGPLSAVLMILAGGAALLAIVGILFFRESASWPRLIGILLSIVGLFLLRG